MATVKESFVDQKLYFNSPDYREYLNGFLLMLEDVFHIRETDDVLKVQLIIDSAREKGVFELHG